jgi:DNA-binding Lrp family transcriptional regulator
VFCARLFSFCEEMFIFGFLCWTYVLFGSVDKADFACGALDAVDLRIVNALLEDCRLSYSKVAAKVGVSVGTAYNRIKVLEAKGLVKGYSVFVDSVKLGFSLTAVIFVQAEGGHLSAVEKEIASSDCVVGVYDVTGEFDAVVIAKFRDRSGLSAFVKHLAAGSHVKRTVTSVSLCTVKEDFRLRLPLP